MKAVFVLAALVAYTAASAVPTFNKYDHIKTKTVDADFLLKQKNLFSLIKRYKEVDVTADYYKIGFEYDVEAHKNDYTDQKAVEEFLYFYKQGFTPKNYMFSVFNDKQRPEAIAVFNLFYYAKDFETFYKTAAFAKVYLNEGMFIYAYYLAVFHRPDTHSFTLPSLFETFPEYFYNKDVIHRMHRTKMQHGVFEKDNAFAFGIMKENNDYVFYANYSNNLVYNNEEQRLSYFTEDVGLNTYYGYFNIYFPFWLKEDQTRFSFFKERFGEFKFYSYQQLLARYYLERLSNGLGEIPQFSWYSPIKTGYSPALYSPFYPYMMRNNYYSVHNEENYDYIRFVDSFEKTYDSYLRDGFFKYDDKVVDLYNSKSFNWITKYWLVADKQMYKNNFERNYEVVGRRLLGAAPEPFNKNEFVPTTFDFFLTSLRDPAFYQFYNRISQYVFQTMKYWKPYTKESLGFPGVKINDFKVDKLTTYFEMFDVDATNALAHSAEELKTKTAMYKIRQPRLNHKPFTVTFDIKSDVETEATFKIFIGPKFDSHGNVLTVEDNWMNFVQLDWFKHKLTTGANKIERQSGDFFFYKHDNLPTSEFYKYFEQGKVPEEKVGFQFFPESFMLPKGRRGGYPYQFFVMVYPGEQLPQEYHEYEYMFKDTKHFIYPFDRPAKDFYFQQPNMFFKDVAIYHEGSMFPNYYNNPYYVAQHNEVPKN